MDNKNYYDILGVNKNSTPKEIKKAYLKMAKKYHPDKFNNANETERKNAKEKMASINNAYDCLSNPQKKQNYDQFGSENGFGGAGSGGGYAHYSTNFNGFDINDLFGNFFNQRGGAGSRSYRSEPRHRRGKNLQVEVSISLEEIFNKSKKTISFNCYDKCGSCEGKGHKNIKITCKSCNGTGEKKEFNNMFSFSTYVTSECKDCNGVGQKYQACTDCYGEGRIDKSKNIDITIPYGVQNNTSITMGSKGEYDKGGYGDLIVVFSIQNHKQWKKIGNQLHTNLTVDLKNVQEEQYKQIRSLDDSLINFQLKKGVYPMPITIKNKGLPINYNTRGDIIINLSVSI